MTLLHSIHKAIDICTINLNRTARARDNSSEWKKGLYVDTVFIASKNSIGTCGGIINKNVDLKR